MNKFKLLQKAKGSFYIYGPANAEIVDKEGDLITGGALEAAVPQLLKRGRFSYEHKDQLVGAIHPSIKVKGKVYKTEVRLPTSEDLKMFPFLKEDKKALFVAGEVWDDTNKSQEVRKGIEGGEIDSYSIAGEATQNGQECTDTCYNKITKIDLSAVTICQSGMNQHAKFKVLAKDAGRALAKSMSKACPPGQHEHSGISGCHPSDTAHREDSGEGGRDPLGARARLEQQSNSLVDAVDDGDISPAIIVNEFVETEGGKNFLEGFAGAIDAEGDLDLATDELINEIRSAGSKEQAGMFQNILATMEDDEIQGLLDMAGRGEKSKHVAKCGACILSEFKEKIGDLSKSDPDKALKCKEHIVKELQSQLKSHPSPEEVSTQIKEDTNMPEEEIVAPLPEEEIPQEEEELTMEAKFAALEQKVNTIIESMSKEEDDEEEEDEEKTGDAEKVTAEKLDEMYEKMKALSKQFESLIPKPVTTDTNRPVVKKAEPAIEKTATQEITDEQLDGMSMREIAKLKI